MHQLIVCKLTGVISNEDDIYLWECIRQDDHLQWLWEEMSNKWALLQGDEKMRLLNPELELESLRQKLGNNRRNHYLTAQRVATTAFIFCYAFCKKLIACK